MFRPTRLKDTDLADTAFRLKLGLPVFLLSWFVLRYVLARGDISRGQYLFIFWIVAPLLAWGCAWAMLIAIDKLSRGLLHSVFATGGQPHSREYSEQQALVAQGRIGEAIDSYRSHIVAFPEDIEARLRLASLLVGPGKQPAAAERVWLEARTLKPSPRQDTVITNALIDLYRTTGKTQLLKAELARFARSHPDTHAGAEARRLLRELVSAEQANLQMEKQ